jgi:predicted RecB family nuclease
MIISSPLFEAYLECDTKCWLRAHAERSTGNTYAEWARLQSASYCEDGREHLLATFPENSRAIAPLISKNVKDLTWRVATDVRLQTNYLESRLQALEKMPSKGRAKPPQFVPYRFQFANTVAKNDKLSLAFDALVLSGAMGCEAGFGKIIHGDRRATLKVKLSSLIIMVRKEIRNLTSLLAGNSPPDLVLNRHCTECEFQARCYKKAKETDDLSLLSGMSKKERLKYRNRGLFSVTQLSYAFRPRRRSKRASNTSVKYDHSLKALAIRENKIHVAGNPSLALPDRYAFFDVEGTPDEQSYYLIGLLLKKPDSPELVRYSLWADDDSEERKIWNEFLHILKRENISTLIHFGSYETTFLRRMKARYSELVADPDLIAKLMSGAINLLSIIYGQIYFPCYSNGLKEIAKFLGHRWSENLTSGLNSIIWRSDWKNNLDDSLKHELCKYNYEDCQALQIVADTITRLCNTPSEAPESGHAEIVRADTLRRAHPYRWERDEFVLEDFRVINQAAYWNYQREKVYVRTSNLIRRKSRTARHFRSHPIDKTVDLIPSKTCPSCRRSGIRTKIVHDLNVGKLGVRRAITRYNLIMHKCAMCEIEKEEGKYVEGLPKDKYGPSFTAFSIFLFIELAISQEAVMHIFNTVFKFRLASGQLAPVKRKASLFYNATYEKLFEKMCNGRLLHVDETRANVHGVNAYVWVFTSLEEVVYIHTATREADLVREKLKNFRGVLVTDFYPAYDAVNCAQQKCLIHLMRDLNNDLMRDPYNPELKNLAQEFALLLRAVVGTVDRFGLKRRYLKKHKREVDCYYRKLAKFDAKSDIVAKYRARFEKNRAKLFTFLDYDGVPWNNNNAEHAVKAFARIRHVLRGSSTDKGLRDYLVLLSICETCKARGVNFLEFLRSRESDIDVFSTHG